MRDKRTCKNDNCIRLGPLSLYGKVVPFTRLIRTVQKVVNNHPNRDFYRFSPDKQLSRIFQID